MDITIMFVVGPPEAGKGTLCTHFAADHGYYHFSVGDHLRELADPSSPHGEDARCGISANELKEILTARLLVPAATMALVVEHKLQSEHKKGHKQFLVDGFPRSDESAEEFEKKVSKPSSVWLFSCDEQVAKLRFCRRARESGDTEAVFDKRYAGYQASLPSLLNRYSNVVEKIDTTNGSADETYATLLQQVKYGRSKADYLQLAYA